MKIREGNILLYKKTIASCEKNFSNSCLKEQKFFDSGIQEEKEMVKILVERNRI